LGVPGLGFVGQDALATLSLLGEVALGFIAFAIGNEFRLSQLQNTGRQAVIVGILQALAAALLEYQRAKMASEKLNTMYSIYAGRMEKDTDEIAPDRTYVADHDIDLLSLAFMRVMSSIQFTDEEASEKIRPLISKRTVSVSEKVFSILRLMLIKGGCVRAIECFNGIRSRHELVAAFMAMLEMLKAGRLTIKEDEIPYEGVIDLENNIYVELYHGKIRVADGE
jgi:hypothetical protein